MSSLVKGEGLALIRGGRLLFEGVDLNLGVGGALHVGGPNGSGKSSLIRMVAGLLRPSAGRVERAEAALADNNLSLDRELPLSSALAFWRGPNLAEAIRAFALEDLVHVPVRLLSTGQAKRAQLARVLASGAPLWLLDEPQNGLDRKGLSELGDAITAHRARGGAIIAASHTPLPGQWTMLELEA